MVATPRSGHRATYLCSDLQDVLERHANVRKSALQQHDDIVLVLLYELRFVRFGAALRVALLDVGLQGRYLFVEVRNVLLDDICELLKGGQTVRKPDPCYS